MPGPDTTVRAHPPGMGAHQMIGGAVGYLRPVMRL